MDRKVLLGIVAGVLLVGTLVGALVIEANNSPDPVLSFPVEWSTDSSIAADEQGTLNEGENETYAVPIDRSNLTEVEVRLVWEDDSGDRDKFELAVQGPGGPQRTNASRNGTVVIETFVGTVPTTGEVNATDRDQARQQLAARHSTDQGRGVWSIDVRLVDAPGVRPVSEAPDLETESDGQNDYQLRVTYHRFHGEIGQIETTG